MRISWSTKCGALGNEGRCGEDDRVLLREDPVFSNARLETGKLVSAGFIADDGSDDSLCLFAALIVTPGINAPVASDTVPPRVRY